MAQRRHFVKCSQGRERSHSVIIDGSAVTTTASATGLLEGSDIFTIVKGTGGASNEVTLAPKEAFKRVPSLAFAMTTTNCYARIKTKTVSSLVIETLQVGDGTTGVDDADFDIHITGWDSADPQA